MTGSCQHFKSNSHARKYFAEDDALPDGKQAVQLDQYIVFVIFVLAIHVELFDALDGQFFLPETNLVRLGCEFICEVSHVVGKRRGKEHDLAITGKLTETTMNQRQHPRRRVRTFSPVTFGHLALADRAYYLLHRPRKF